MYAIFETGGKQYKVEAGDVIFVEKLEITEGETIKFDKVLAVSGKSSLTVGNPVVAGASIEAKIVGHGKAKKVLVFHYKPKKQIRKTQGHRQAYTKIKIEKILA